MRISNEIRVELKVGEEVVVFHLRQPSNQELNEFLNKRFTLRRTGLVDTSTQARSDFFDLLLLKVENLEDEDGQPITPERKDKIPLNWKNTIILQLFETEEINIKK